MLAMHKFIELKNLHNDVRIGYSPKFLLIRNIFHIHVMFLIELQKQLLDNYKEIQKMILGEMIEHVERRQI